MKSIEIRRLGLTLTVLLLSFQIVACRQTAMIPQIPGRVSETISQQLSAELISVEDLAERIEQNRAPLIIDVRSSAEYAEGHIPGAINIHFRDIANQLNVIRAAAAAANTAEILLYCERGVRAGIAYRQLAKAEFETIYQLTGDMPAWRAASLPIETAPIETQTIEAEPFEKKAIKIEPTTTEAEE